MNIHETIERDENLKSFMAIDKANELVIEMEHEVENTLNYFSLQKY